MEPCGSSPVWQQSITCSYPKPDQSIPPPSYFLTIHFSITIPSTPRSYKLHLSITFPYGKLYAPLLSLTRATCPSHLAILDLIILTIFGEAYTSVGLNGSLGTGWTIRGWKPVEARFSAPGQTGPVALLALCTTSSRSFPEAKSRG